jgi:hypothetical protein
LQRELLLRDEEVKKQLAEKLEEARLSREELELRVASLASAEGSKNSLLQEVTFQPALESLLQNSP